MSPFVPAPVKPAVPLSLLQQVDIRVGTIVAAADVQGSDRLVELTVHLGDHTRQILAGMKQERADPQAIVGRQALFVVNLEPRRMLRRISEGMLFDIGAPDGLIPVLAVPEVPIPDGAQAG